ncbi:MarR family winged helix-turn-helix transcriptional regulator [Actinomycetospora sp. CA-101289]|uniref:MarR family winged helix-turn-helix transcriptional regulator n=1 Tax=Actinomycetospora sp. CA-101289 TaxID=3239893 RepID=UPI003D96D65F
MGVDPDGTRVSDLAERAAMTKQAVGELIRHLAAHGYLTVEPDLDDRRAKRVALTERGWDALELGERVIADYDTWLETIVGVDRVADLRETLDRIIASPDHAARDRDLRRGDGQG